MARLILTWLLAVTHLVGVLALAVEPTATAEPLPAVPASVPAPTAMAGIQRRAKGETTTMMYTVDNICGYWGGGTCMSDSSFRRHCCGIKLHAYDHEG
jgi:hypothetical protein